MHRDALKKRKADSYQKAVMSNFLVGKADGQAMKPCPICGVYYKEGQLVKHASICGIDTSTLSISQTQTETQTEPSQSDNTPSPSRVEIEAASPINSKEVQDDKLSVDDTPTVINPYPVKKRCVESGPLKSVSKTDHLRQDQRQNIPSQENVFSKLMKSASEAAQNEKFSKSVSHFRLDVVQGALLITFRHDEEEEEPHVGACMASWSEEVHFRQVLHTMTFDKEAKSTEEWTKVDARDKRMDMRVMISTNLPCAEAPTSVLGADSQGEIDSNSMRYYAVYKSMLQKAVRRRDANKAARLAARMIALSSTELFRRVPIICLEDATLHPEFGVIVWVMLALSKGYRPPLCLLETCLAFVSDLASSSFRDLPLDCVPLSLSTLSRSIDHESDNALESSSDIDVPLSKTASGPSHCEPGSRSVRVSLRDLPQGSRRTLVMSLLFRASYGGMRFDVAMLESMARLWTLRFFYGPTYLVTDLDKLRLPTMKFNIHQSVILSLMSSSAWGKQCVDAYSDPAMVSSLKKELHASVRSALTSRGGADDSEIPNPELLARALPLRKVDLMEPGLDFHCDAGLCEYVLRTLRQNFPEKYERLTHLAKAVLRDEGCGQSDYDAMVLLVKRCIWTFRSSVNGHKTWDVCGENEVKEALELHIKSELDGKRRIAPAWGLMAPTITSYCARKVSFIAEKEGLVSS